MTELLYKIIPLDLASTLSPGILALSIIVLMLLNIFFVTLPATFPLAIYVIFPLAAHRVTGCHFFYELT